MSIFAARRSSSYWSSFHLLESPGLRNLPSLSLTPSASFMSLTILRRSFSRAADWTRPTRKAPRRKSAARSSPVLTRAAQARSTPGRSRAVSALWRVSRAASASSGARRSAIARTRDCMRIEYPVRGSLGGVSGDDLAADAALVPADIRLVGDAELPGAAAALCGEDLAAALGLHLGAETVLVLAPAVPALPHVTHGGPQLKRFFRVTKDIGKPGPSQLLLRRGLDVDDGRRLGDLALRIVDLGRAGAARRLLVFLLEGRLVQVREDLAHVLLERHDRRAIPLVVHVV